MPQPSTAQSRVIALEREEQALKLKIEGMGTPAIGVELGVSRQGAHAILVRAMAKASVEIAELAKHAASVEVGRIERLILAVWPAADGGDLAAIDRVNSLSARKAKLLGLDAPTRQEVKDTTPPQHPGLADMSTKELLKYRELQKKAQGSDE